MPLVVAGVVAGSGSAAQGGGPLADAVAGSGEGALLVRHRAGEPDAFAELLAAYRAPVFGYLARCGVAPAERDDLFQEIFLKIHRGASSYDAARPLKSWLFTVVANAVRSHFRRAVVPQVPIESEGPQALADLAPAADRAYAAREDAALLERALAVLPLAQREVVLLTCIEGMDQNEVAKALGIPVNTVKTHLRRGRLALARELARGGERRNA